jgi:hypothetical protein
MSWAFRGGGGNIEDPRVPGSTAPLTLSSFETVTMNDKNAEIRVAIVSFRTVVVSLVSI